MQSENNYGTTERATRSTQADAAAEGGAAEQVTLRPTIEVNSENASDTASPNDAAVQLAADLKAFQKLAVTIKANLNSEEDYETRCNSAFNLANDLFGHAPTWICFFREVMAADGLVQQLFPDEQERAQFMKTKQYDDIQMMLTALRSRELPENDPNDPQRMITVRLPKSLHEALCEEARCLKISVNRLCITRLLQALDTKMVPKACSKPRGRKPRVRETAAETTTAPVTATTE